MNPDEPTMNASFGAYEEAKLDCGCEEEFCKHNPCKHPVALTYKNLGQFKCTTCGVLLSLMELLEARG